MKDKTCPSLIIIVRNQLDQKSLSFWLTFKTLWLCFPHLLINILLVYKAGYYGNNKQRCYWKIYVLISMHFPNFAAGIMSWDSKIALIIPQRSLVIHKINIQAPEIRKSGHRPQTGRRVNKKTKKWMLRVFPHAHLPKTFVYKRLWTCKEDMSWILIFQLNSSLSHPKVLSNINQYRWEWKTCRHLT